MFIIMINLVYLSALLLASSPKKYSLLICLVIRFKSHDHFSKEILKHIMHLCACPVLYKGNNLVSHRPLTK